MTISPGDPGPTDPESGDRKVPPYDDRQQSGEVDEDGAHKDGANVGGATGPVEDDDMKSPDPADTERGATASPADEQPAADTPDGEADEGSTGPTHEAGTGRGEDKSRDDHDQGSGESAR